MFAGPYTWDNAKTEESHLELLAKVAPSKAVRKTLKWFKHMRVKTYFKGRVGGSQILG